MSSRKLRHIIAGMLILAVLLPGGALAYSYGDPNTEEVAESFKEIVVELNKNPSDWKKADAIYRTMRAEISSHFDEDIAVTLDANIADEDQDAFIANYKNMLVMNLQRRFDYTLMDFDDYSKTKLLMAKAKGTYEVLKPYIPADRIVELDEAFNQAWTALGNPGLFGVGEKPSDEGVFKEEIKLILDTLIPLFPTHSAVMPMEDGTAQEPANSPGIDSPATDQEAAVSEQDDTENEPDAGAAVSEPVESDRDDGQTGETSAQPVAEQSGEQSGEQSDEESGDEATEDSSAGQSVASDTKAAPEHAPMERTTKTNSVVSVVVVSVVALIMGFAIWYLRKSKMTKPE